MNRKPDFQIPGYLNRWHLIPRNRWFNIYLHQFIGPDPQPRTHDHPWWSVSIRLRGDYEEMADSAQAYFNRRVTFRSAECMHKIFSIVTPTCWTLFITGPIVRDWGFWVDGEWVKHTEYLANKSLAYSVPMPPQYPDTIHDGEMPRSKMSEITKARLLGAHVAFAGRFTRGKV